jgi:thioredoxin 1
MDQARIELDETNFEQEVMDATHPVMVQAWASWSAPCREMTPLLESVAGGGVGPVKLARLNVEQNEQLAIQYGVWAVPTVLIFNLGSLQDQIVGRATEAQVREKLERYR